jgi:hypothetical protein
MLLDCFVPRNDAPKNTHLNNKIIFYHKDHENLRLPVDRQVSIIYHIKKQKSYLIIIILIDLRSHIYHIKNRNHILS